MWSVASQKRHAICVGFWVAACRGLERARVCAGGFEAGRFNPTVAAGAGADAGLVEELYMLASLASTADPNSRLGRLLLSLNRAEPGVTSGGGGGSFMWGIHTWAPS